MVNITTSQYGSPEQDPFLLLESSLRCIEGILCCHVNQPLRRSWIEHPYGEEEIALLEEEMLPVLPSWRKSWRRKLRLSSCAVSWRLRVRGCEAFEALLPL